MVAHPLVRPQCRSVVTLREFHPPAPALPITRGGVAVFGDLRVLRRPDVTSNITFRSTLVSARRGEQARRVDLSATMEVPLAWCRPGQWLDDGNKAAPVCRACAVGTFQASENVNASCQVCARGSVAYGTVGWTRCEVH